MTDNAWADLIDLKRAVTHRSTSAGTGGVTDTDLGERVEGEQRLYREGVIDDAFDAAKATAREHHTLGSFVVGKGDGTDVFTTSAEHQAEKGFRAADRPAIKALGTLPNEVSPLGFSWVLTEADQESVLQGYYCEMCLQAQHDRDSYLVHGNCHWAIGNKTAAKGCGWNALLKQYSGGNRAT